MPTVLSRPAGDPLATRPTIAAPVCVGMGVAFIVIAIWGFVTGDRVLVFSVNAAHNIVHLVSGLASLAVGLAGERPARAFCLSFGVVYALVAVLGFLNVPFALNLLNLNDADDWLHTIIAAAFLAGAFVPRPAPGAGRDR